MARSQTVSSAKKRPKWWERLGALVKHPFFSLCGLIAAAIAGTAAVGLYFSNRQESLLEADERSQVSELQSDKAALREQDTADQAKIQQLTDQMSSINRKLAGGDFFNVARLVISGTDSSGIGLNSKFFPEDQFYADNPPGWIYKVMDEDSICSEIFATEYTLRPPYTNVHLWQKGDSIKVESNGPLHAIAPMIMVERNPVDSVYDALDINSPDVQSILPAVPDNQRELMRDQVNKALKSKLVFRGDILGASMVAGLGRLFQLRYIDGYEVKIVSTQKVGNVFYSQIAITIHDAKLGGRQVSALYVNVETIAFSTTSDCYVINLLNPGEEPVPRGATTAEMTAWLNDFRILAQ